MKRIVFKFFVLSVLVTGSMFIFETQQSAAANSCWESAYNKWNQCDGAYGATSSNYATRHDQCDNSAQISCAQSTQSTCSAHANTVCGSNSGSQCWGTAYNSCYQSTFQTCYTGTYNSCSNERVDSYAARYNNYSSCLGFEGDLGNCIEQMEDGCTAAQNRLYVCGAMYSGPDDGDAYQICRTASGINRCQ